MPNWIEPPSKTTTSLTYHNNIERWSKDEDGNNLLQSVAKGQEFVAQNINEQEFESWFLNILEQSNNLKINNQKEIKRKIKM